MIIPRFQPVTTVLMTALLAASACVPDTAFAGQPLVELRIGDKAYEGRIADRGRTWCVLFDRAGQMHTIDLDQVTQFRKVSSNFTPHTIHTLRTLLLKEFGGGFEVSTSRHYVVCAPRGRARVYNDIFEQTWRRFHMYFAVRGFQMDDPEFPMVAVVLKDRKSFLEYARREKASVDSSILGYYWSTHNRVVMFEDQQSRAALPGRRLTTDERLLADSLRGPVHVRDARANRNLEESAWSWAFGTSGEVALRSGITSSLRETMIHEATHQLGYNLGLHNRTGRNPKWVVEGLATVFETAGMEKYATDRDATKRINPGWRYGFQKFVADGRPDGFLETYIRDDRFFETDLSHAYAQAWALSFWLIETRPRAYARFLQQMASSGVAKQLTAEIRVSLFKESFGDNLRLLDAEMLRYYDRLK